MNCVPPEEPQREGRNLLRPWADSAGTDDTSTHVGADAMNCVPPERTTKLKTDPNTLTPIL